MTERDFMRLRTHFIHATAASLILFSFAGRAYGQTKSTKPLLIINVEKEKTNLNQPAAITEISAPEVRELQAELEQELGKIFEIIPEADKRDCFELSVVLEKLKVGNAFFYVGSSAIALGKGDNDLLYTHNPVIEPTLKKVTAALGFQLSMIQLQAFVPHGDGK